ncbi:MAG: flagellar motor switch protein FliM [Actinobacteria bacterium]|nr:MAG: flagellar motor switch protein FliM [Actinomycetota bacterium]
MGRRSGGGGPHPYDFRRPIKLSREHVRTLQIAFETYARSGSTLLTSRLRTVSHLNLIAIEQLTYEEYISSLSSPTVLASVTLEPLAGTTLFEMSLTTAMAAIDHMLGGPGGPQPERPLTDIELPLLRGLLERLLDELRYALDQLVEVQPKLGVIEYNPQFVRSHSPGDAVVVASFELKVGQEECVSTICMPFSSILPVLEADGAETQLSAEELAARQAARKKIAAGLYTAPLDVAVRFESIRMRTDDIVQLRPGDVVPLNHPVSRPLAVTVNDTVFAWAVPGNQGSRLACLIVPSPTEENAE